MVAVAVPYHVRSIEADIAQRTAAALANRGVAARVAVSGRDVALVGEVAGDDVRQLARAAVGETWGVRDVIDRLVVPAAGDGEAKTVAVCEQCQPRYTRCRVRCGSRRYGGHRDAPSSD